MPPALTAPLIDSQSIEAVMSQDAPYGIERDRLEGIRVHQVALYGEHMRATEHF